MPYGMNKVFDPSGWNYNQPVMTLVKLSSRGLVGDDRRDFIKVAGHQFLAEIDNLKHARDEVPVHALAMGATEFWSANRNGDGWKTATLRQYHPTFEKHAKWYRNHKNQKDAGDPYYGYIKRSMYNEAMHRVELLCMLNAEKSAADRNGGFVADKEIEKLARGADLAVSMACALPGTLVKVMDETTGFKPVEQILVGDQVLTHRGRYREVTAVARRTKQQYVEVKLRYAGRRTLRFTSDHLFYVARWADLPRGKTANKIRSSHPSGLSGPTRTARRHELAAHARWVPCGELRPGDMLLMPKACGGQSWSSLAGRTARLLGYYMAEGSMTSDGYLCLTCNKMDAAVTEIHDLVDCSVSAIEHSGSDKAVNVTVYDKTLSRQVVECVGRGVRNKHIPRTVYAAAADAKLEFLSAWFNGDGWQDGKGLHWSTCSEPLSVELQMLLASIDVPASVYRNDHTSDLPGKVARTGDGIEYSVNVSNRYSGLFVGRSKAELVEMRADKTTAFITGDYLALPVASLRFVEDEVEVYDLTVDDDESFTAYGMAVHNCRVPHDVCASCGNKARTRAEYCTGVDEGGTCKHGGCKHNLAKVADDGFMLHVDNPEPCFFDLSSVFRPADRTAYGARADWLAKAAGHGFTPGAEMAEMLGVAAPSDVLRLVDASGLSAYDVRTQRAVKLARALATLERTYTPAPEVRMGLAGRAAVDVSAYRPKAAAFLAALADRGGVLPFADYASLHNQAASAAQLAGAFGRVADRPDLLKAAGLHDVRAVGPETKAAEALAPSLSLFPEYVADRAMHAAARGEAAPALIAANKAAAADDPAARNLADRYAAYQVAAVLRMAEPAPGTFGAAKNADDLALTARLVVAQNKLR